MIDTLKYGDNIIRSGTGTMWDEAPDNKQIITIRQDILLAMAAGGMKIEDAIKLLSLYGNGEWAQGYAAARK